MRRTSYTFEDVETVRCPKCASGPNNRCWIMAGRGVTSQTKTIPHMERCIAYIKSLEPKEKTMSEDANIISQMTGPQAYDPGRECEHMPRKSYAFCGLCEKRLCTSCWPIHEQAHYHNTPGYEALRRQ